MNKMKRILAWMGIILLLGLYLITFLLGIFGSEATKGMLMASIACTVILPCLMYGMILMTKVLGNKEPENIETENTEAESIETESTEAESIEAESTETESTEAESTEAENIKAENATHKTKTLKHEGSGKKKN